MTLAHAQFDLLMSHATFEPIENCKMNFRLIVQIYADFTSNTALQTEYFRYFRIIERLEQLQNTRPALFKYTAPVVHGL